MIFLGGISPRLDDAKNELIRQIVRHSIHWIQESAFRRPTSSSKFAWHRLVQVAPDPSFSGLDGTDQRMLSFVKMLGCMLILGRVATADVPANKAHAEVDPLIASLHTVLTYMLVGLSNLDLIKVGTLFRHRFLQRLARSSRTLTVFAVPSKPLPGTVISVTYV
jgi:hypothetical protein